MIRKSANHSKFYLGIDVGGTRVKFGVFDVKKKLVDEFLLDTTIHEKNAEKLLTREIFNTIDNYCDNNKIGFTKNKIAGIGFAVPGPVVNNVVYKAINLNWKKKYNLVSATKKHFGSKVKIVVYNDANAAVLGESLVALKGKYKSVCLITLGTGIGTGIIIDGKLVEGKSGIAGEISHIRVDYSENAKRCNCGNVGCVETVASCVGLANVYNRILKNNTFVRDARNEAKEIIHLAKKGDKTALKALNISLDYISRLIAILMHVYEPEVVLIGGGMSNAGTFITDIIKKHLKEKIFMTKTLPKIMIAKLKNKAGVYGVVSIL